MKSQYDHYNILDTNRISYRSHTHKNVKAVLDAYPFDNITLGIEGFFKLFTGCKLLPADATKARLNTFFSVANKNLPHLTGNIINYGSAKAVLHIIANIMKTIYLCDSKVSGDGLYIKACSAVMIKHNGLLYRGGTEAKSEKKDVPIIVIKS
jgi:hypothetical protein